MIQPLGEPTIAVPELPARGSCCVCPKRPSSPSVKPAEDGNGVTSCGCTTPPTDVPADSPQASPVSPPLILRSLQQPHRRSPCAERSDAR
ncbi:MAG: hypothetical protein R2856_00240 [Caldilineaceae bacterium]